LLDCLLDNIGQMRAGDHLLFHRIASIDRIDVFEAVMMTSSEWHIFYLDLYHPRRSRLAPEGFKLATRAAQFSGFNQLCPDFPYGFPQAKRDEQSGLRLAYIPLSLIDDQLKTRVYVRPRSHLALLQQARKSASFLMLDG